MTLLMRPSNQPGDDVDKLLRSFFQSEMPDPWPSLEAPAPRTLALPARPAPARGSLFRSRLALAASIALLIGGSLMLGGNAPDGRSSRNNVFVPTDRGDATKTPIRIRLDAKSGETLIEGDFPLPPDMPMK